MLPCQKQEFEILSLEEVWKYVQRGTSIKGKNLDYGLKQAAAELKSKQDRTREGKVISTSGLQYFPQDLQAHLHCEPVVSHHLCSR